MSSSPQTLSGKVAIVTGAARGIGAACAQKLAAAGAHVVVNDILEPTETISLIESAGGMATAAVGDVTNRERVAEIVSQTKTEQGRIDYLVTNAAYSDRELFYQANLEGFEKTINVCMWGPFNFLREVSNVLIEQGEGGAIVCISSPHSYVAIPGAMAYNMAKAAVDQMARTAACELAEHRIRVNIVHPGWTDTPGERKFFHESELSEKGGELPWGRLAKPEEIASVIAFLLSEEASFINGVNLPVDGGVSASNGQPNFAG